MIVHYRAPTDEDRAAEKRAVEEMKEATKGIRLGPVLPERPKS
jgi:hypothetical protein